MDGIPAVRATRGARLYCAPRVAAVCAPPSILVEDTACDAARPVVACWPPAALPIHRLDTPAPAPMFSHSGTPRAASALQSALLFALATTVAAGGDTCAVRYDSICSSRGVQPFQPWVSDDFVVGCIMVMFLLLFCFGKQ